ncbi:hypothetical protein DFH07DRAFT_965784 [Mycena maculata]|uniref:Uncharacterized protein n=1 Tax=Mycena maculata TaxID=230809 RepID=A0AAD7IBB3_9AGAR|nr:hypothetical protein DFH07DRAFT_965784 [Mycena maculata]
MSTQANPFATYEESTSAILVVCKAWLRVSTPLLYRVVTLGDSSKKLRVEGGFGTFMHGTG